MPQRAAAHVPSARAHARRRTLEELFRQRVRLRRLRAARRARKLVHSCPFATSIARRRISF